MFLLRGEDPLHRHVTHTYASLRTGIGVIGLGLPVALWLGGAVFDGESLRGSMSAYYYSPAMGDLFVGSLFSVGVFLYLYKGFSRAEDWSLNLAGLLALGVALAPTRPPGALDRVFTWHGVFAVSFFVCIAYVCIFRASDTLSLIRDTSRARALRRLYRILGALMLAAPAGAVLLGRVIQNEGGPNVATFLVEAAGVWVFGAYWLAKSRELARTDADRLAMEGKLHRTAAAGSSQPGRLVQIEPGASPMAELADMAAAS